MKKTISLFLSVILMVSLALPAYAVNNSDAKYVVKQQNFDNLLIDNETLLEKGLDGEFIDSENTKVEEIPGDIKTIRITKVHSKTTLNDGTIVESCEVSDNKYLTEQDITSQASNENDDSSIKLLSFGGDDDTDPSVTVRVTSTIYYNKYTTLFDYYQLTSSTIKAVMLDSRFALKKLVMEPKQFDSLGCYYPATGVETGESVYESTSYSNSNPTAGQTYTCNTNFIKSVMYTDASFPFCGSVNTVYYKRLSDMHEYSFSVTMDINRLFN